MMRFFNVYPKRLWATLSGSGAFEGQFTFDLEQYGLVTTGMVCYVVVEENIVMPGEWRIVVKPLLSVEMPHFDQFEETLNYYVFEVLQLMPSRSAPGKELPAIKIFFDGIYFDMSGAKPKVEKIATGV